MPFVPKIAVVGDTIVDIQAGPLNAEPKWSTNTSVSNFEILVGGSGCNSARYLAAMGIQTRLFSCVGDDELSNTAVETLTKENRVHIDGSLVTIENRGAPIAMVLYGSKEIQKRVIVYNLGSVLDFTSNLIDKEMLFSYDHLHFGGYFVCTALHTLEFVKLLEQAKTRGLTISMDSQFDGKDEWTGENGHLSLMYPLLDVFMPSEWEALHITKTETIADSLNVLADAMPNALLIVKNGENGVFYTLPDGKREIKRVFAFPTSEVVDTTGAGDSFNAGFLREWVREKKMSGFAPMDEKTVRRALKSGCATAKFCVQGFGAFVDNIPVKEIDELVES